MAYQVSRVLWASRKSPHQSGPYSACPEELLPVWRESWWRELCSHSCPPHKKVLFTAQDCRTAQELCPMKGALLCRSRIQAGCSVKGNSYQLCAPCLLITSSHANHRLLICNCWLTQGGLNKGLIIVCFVPTKNAPPPLVCVVMVTRIDCLTDVMQADWAGGWAELSWWEQIRMNVSLNVRRLDNKSSCSGWRQTRKEKCRSHDDSVTAGGMGVFWAVCSEQRSQVTPAKKMKIISLSK